MNRTIARILVKDADGKFLVFWHRKIDGSLEPDLPGGGREPDESFIDCAKRELREETGLKPGVDYHRTMIRPFINIHYDFINHLGQPVKADGILYQCSLWRSQPHLIINEPSLDRFEWLTREQLQVLGISYLKEVYWS